MFFRIHTDGVRTPVDLRSHFAGPTASTCWIVGGGPSLEHAPCDRIQLSPIPRFAINLCGFGRIRPDLWTAYDPTIRFHRTTFLNAAILKLLPARRARDVVPGTTHKVGDCPNTLFFERDGQCGFHNFLGPAMEAGGACVVDWQDSFIQAISLAWWLGFRRLLLVGCDMHVRPPEDHIAAAAARRVTYQPEELLRGFYERCRAAGLEPAALEADAPIQPYHFDETKSLAAVQQTDFHYFRVAQYLRLSRRAMALAGLELISATPNSRLNAFFPYRPAEELLDEIADAIGDAARETTRGQYARRLDQGPHETGFMRDFRPHNWGPAGRGGPGPAVGPVDDAGDCLRFDRLANAVAELPDVMVPIEEAG